ncbi:MAG: hypothetical protein QG608_3010 [Actinomycetota bacterium]|nr:hypothetical protein [Actinomycetota bacterium]
MVPVGTADTPSPDSSSALVPGSPGPEAEDAPATRPDDPGDTDLTTEAASSTGDGSEQDLRSQRWWVVPLANALVLLLLLGAVVFWVLSDGGWHRPLRTAPEKQHPAPASHAPTDALPTGSSWPDMPPQAVGDGADPQRANCDVEVSTLAHRDLALPTGKVLGRIELRHSRKCNTSWARFTPASGFAAPRTMLVSVRTRRLQEGTRSPASVAFGAGPVTDVMLMAGKGCVTASVSLTENTSLLAQATTDCLEPDS